MTTVRRGLPRIRGGEAWPPAGVVAASALDADAAPEVVAPGVVERASAEPAAAPGVVERAERDETRSVPDGVSSRAPAASSLNDPVGASVSSAAAPGGAAAVASSDPATGSVLRRGLPRVAGGEPWPPSGAPVPGLVSSTPGVVERAATPGVVERAATPGVVERAERDETRSVPDGVSSQAPEASSLNDPVGAAASSAAVASSAPATGSVLRRGLPRVAGGEPWPPAGTVVVVAERDDARQVPDGVSSRAPVASSLNDPVGSVASSRNDPVGATGSAVVVRPDVSAPLPFTRTVWNGSAPRHVAAEPATSKLRPTWPQAIGGLFAAAGLAVLAGAAIAIVRAFLSLPFMQDFLTTYPGEYHLPAGAPVGIPGWIGWQHFFNVFLMTLIIRSGLRVRSEKRPTAFWTPRGNPKGKISLTLWFHQGLDLLWIINGVIFVVLLFVTGQWMRIVPTSWDVFPNALSAALQYVSFDWPTENGWVNYNSLQQLAYFTIVFLAAPVAIATGFRMSGLWPKKAAGLSKAYPIEIARALHFPTMLFFTAFIVVHVALVLLTGMLRNLNHMFAAQDAVTWTGFWVFVLSLVVIAAGWAAARPLVLAPIAKLFGQVSGR